MQNDALTLQSNIISYFTSSPKHPNDPSLNLLPQTKSISFEEPKPTKKPKYIIDFSNVFDYDD
jgi:hypothetical protein